MRWRASITGMLALSMMLSVCACKRSVNWNVDCDAAQSMIFQTGFNNCAIYEKTKSQDVIRGMDTAFNDFNDWAMLDHHTNIGTCTISYEDGDASQRYAAITADPADPANTVLLFKIIEPHIREGYHKKGRVQINLNDNQCIKAYYQTVRLYLHPDMASLKQYAEKISWLSLFEFWNNANFSGERNPFRVTVNLVKTQDGPVENMYFKVKGERDIRLGGWDALWQETATGFPVPFGAWMEIELYIQEGDGDTGRFYFAVTPQGSPKQVLFDITNATQHPRERYPDGYTHMNPLKLYTDDKLIQFMKDNGKNLEVYWDDWTFYRSTKPF